ncbi:hypothetical protein SRHO_G00038230 [Serrasalmus rhombeus]
MWIDINQMLWSNRKFLLFLTLPISVATTVAHDVVIDSHSPTRQHPYRVHPQKRSLLKETDYLLENGFAVPSTSFETIKSLLISTPVLAAPDYGRPFKLEVDASGAGIGAVLQEDVFGVDHPLCYFSRKFNRHQLAYSAIEKEALALLLSLQHFEVYIHGSVKPITLFTDHNPLVFLQRMVNANHRLMRWSLIIQGFNLEIVHKKGVDNVVADDCLILT